MDTSVWCNCIRVLFGRHKKWSQFIVELLSCCGLGSPNTHCAPILVAPVHQGKGIHTAKPLKINKNLQPSKSYSLQPKNQDPQCLLSKCQTKAQSSLLKELVKASIELCANGSDHNLWGECWSWLIVSSVAHQLDLLRTVTRLGFGCRLWSGSATQKGKPEDSFKSFKTKESTLKPIWSANHGWDTCGPSGPWQYVQQVA